MMNIEDIDKLIIEYEIDDILFPYIKRQLKILFFTNIIIIAVSFFKLINFNMALIVVLLSTISGLLVFAKLLTVLALRDISKVYFFRNMFPLRVIIPFEFFFLKKDQNGMVYIGWLFWFTVCILEINKMNHYLLFLVNLVAFYIGAFCTFFVASHLYYVFVAKKYKH